ncbi:hypothetical protein Nocox_30020 [Nonomuraea coxensis DSM 45129]|uniref:Uncharacterized protein n=1 Tax=Nonomuraea coxensis DSM 45129 TaxID=1122611 RepID=A0ABX8UA40_9ACTN|nr:hypothetical protein [Nonomuraea coxensis]QYC43588.1 hypothetical protein Nocox_30020 [Nonomuraea coxensis DSM 45129]
MVRDENDRPYEDGQGRPVNPDLTGDVLSPRWSTDDTDEQPAIQVPAGETYILPPEPGHDVLDDVPAALPAAGQAQDGEPAYLPLDRAYDGPSDDDRPVSGPDDDGYDGRAHDAGSYEGGPRDSGPYDIGFDDERPRRGFLGSGWTDEPDDDGRSGPEREVRRRTRMLVLAAVAVVLIGVGAGFALTGGSSDPCAGGRCASAGQVSAPADPAVTEDEAAEEETAEPAEEETAGPEESATADPSPTTAPARPTREPAARPTATRSEERATRPSERPSRSQEPETRDTEDQPGTIRDSQTEQRATTEQRTQTEEPSEEPVTQEPEPTPTQEERKGLFDYLFPWA